jgi:hypothetical protein
MIAPAVGVVQHVVQHLDRLCMLDLCVLLVAHGFDKVLVDQLSQYAPGWCVIHQKQMVAFADDLADFIRWSVAGSCALLLQKFLDNSAISENDRRPRSEFESVHAAILLGPFCKSVPISLDIRTSRCLKITEDKSCAWEVGASCQSLAV